MTHLYIELNTGLTEEVNSSIISKLYELAISGDLDNTSDLKGRLHASLGSKYKVDYLTDSFDDLYISVDTYTIDFEDTNVESIVVSKIGVDNVVTQSAAEAVTYIGPTWFRNDTTIVKFNEFRYFTGLGSNNNACNQMFLNCSNLKEVTLPSNLVYIHSEMFGSCSSLESITIPNSVHKVINLGFTMCTALKSLTFTGLTGVCSVGQRLDALESLTLNEGCTSLTINNTPTSNLTSLTLPASITSLNIANMKGVLTVTFAQNSQLTTTPGYGGFNGCTNLTTLVNFPWDTWTTMGSYCFSGCQSLLGTIKTPVGLTTIEQNTFDAMLAIDTIIIDSAVTSIATNNFRYIRTGAKVIMNPTSPPTLAASVGGERYGAAATTGCVFYVPDASYNDYISNGGQYWTELYNNGRIKKMSELPS